MVDHDALILPCENQTILQIGHVTSVYLHFYQPYNNQTGRHGRSAGIDLTLQV